MDDEHCWGICTPLGEYQHEITCTSPSKKIEFDFTDSTLNTHYRHHILHRLERLSFQLLMQGTFHKLLHTIHIPTVIQIIFLTRLHLNLHFYNTKCHRVACLLLQLKKTPLFFSPNLSWCSVIWKMILFK